MIPPLLISYCYYQSSRGIGGLQAFVDRLLEEDGACLMIDSGAFTAWNAGIRIRLTTYIEACKYFLESPRVWGCVQMDVIGDAIRSERNLYAMVKAGVRPMPVLTIDAPCDRIKEFQQINNRICISHLGNIKGSREGKQEWERNRMRSAKGMVPTAELHGLAYIRSPAEIYSSGLTSCDSTSHSVGERFGTMARFKQGHGIENITPRNFAAASAETMAWIKECGCTNDDIHDDYLFRRGPCSFIAFAGAVAHGLQALQFRNHGIILFQAASSWMWCARILIALRFALPDGRFDFIKAREELRCWQMKPRQRIGLLGETLQILQERSWA